MVVKEKAYAKINLALEVMNKVDGYHLVNNLMVPISLYDELELEKDDDIYIIDDNIDNNICIKAAKVFFKHFNINGGVKIKLVKNIPIAAGLAGGSSDAAAVLRGLNKLYNINASSKELELLAAMLGSDVPFFINTKASLCTNRGEIVNPLDFNIPNIDILLIKPKSTLSTKEVYQNYKYDNISKKNKIDNLFKALKDNNINLLIENIFNDLAKVAISLNKELKDIYIKIKNNNVFISGSGPTIFIVKPTDEQIKEINNMDYYFVSRCNTIK